MGKLRVLSGREVCKILEAEGFSEVRRRGSRSLHADHRGHGHLAAKPNRRHEPQAKGGRLAGQRAQDSGVFHRLRTTAQSPAAVQPKEQSGQE